MRVARRKWNGRTKVEMEDVASHLWSLTSLALLLVFMLLERSLDLLSGLCYMLRGFVPAHPSSYPLHFTCLPTFSPSPSPLFPTPSLLAVKHGIDVGAGVVDADYRGLLGVLLFNFGDQDFVGEYTLFLLIFFLKTLKCFACKSNFFHQWLSLITVNSGDRIAQLVIEQIRCLEVEEVKVSLLSWQCFSKLFLTV